MLKGILRPLMVDKSKTVVGHSTAITRNNLSIPVQYLLNKGFLDGSIIDYGCGKGFDFEYLKCDGYDPYHRDVAILDKYDIGLCTYVLNVVDKVTQKRIIRKLKKLTTVSYVSVRRDLPEEGRQGRGCWQNYVKLNEPVIHETSKYIIYKIGG